MDLVEEVCDAWVSGLLTSISDLLSMWNADEASRPGPSSSAKLARFNFAALGGIVMFIDKLLRSSDLTIAFGGGKRSFGLSLFSETFPSLSLSHSHSHSLSFCLSLSLFFCLSCLFFHLSLSPFLSSWPIEHITFIGDIFLKFPFHLPTYDSLFSFCSIRAV
jgi:hypothetical protein